MIKILSYGALLVVASLAVSCTTKSNKTTSSTIGTLQDNSQQSSFKDSLVLVELSRSILGTIKAKNYIALAKFIDPVKGVRCSPYATVDTTDNRIISEEEFTSYRGSGKKYHWGSEDASGDSLRLSLAEYFHRWVYDVDFINAPNVAVDKVLGGGNSLDNLKEIYPNLHFVEFHFPGFDKKFEGMDWRSLRLVFRKIDNKYFLLAIIHDEWTI